MHTLQLLDFRVLLMLRMVVGELQFFITLLLCYRLIVAICLVARPRHIEIDLGQVHSRC